MSSGQVLVCTTFLGSFETLSCFVDLLTCGRYSHCVGLFLYCFSSSARSCWFVTMVGIYLHVRAHAHQVDAFFASEYVFGSVNSNCWGVDYMNWAAKII